MQLFLFYFFIFYLDCEIKMPRNSLFCLNREIKMLPTAILSKKTRKIFMQSCISLYFSL